MLNYRISKYNPSNSYENYHFYNDEWSSFQDVGEKMDSVVLTLDEYKKVETAYIDTIIDLMDSNGISNLTINEIVKNKQDIELKIEDEISANEVEALYKELRNGLTIEKDTIEKVCRLILRGYLWCKLEYKKNFYLHFGYDYYMYVGFPNCDSGIMSEVRNRGLYFNEMKSPYRK